MGIADRYSKLGDVVDQTLCVMRIYNIILLMIAFDLNVVANIIYQQLMYNILLYKVVSHNNN